VTLTFDAYWPLALLSLVPFVWWMPGHTLTNFNRRQMRVQAAARAAIVAFVSLALAGPVLHRTTGELSLVFAVDVSESVAPASIAEAARWIEWPELTDEVNPLLRDSGLGGLAYRARLHERVRAILLATNRAQAGP